MPGGTWPFGGGTMGGPPSRTGPSAIGTAGASQQGAAAGAGRLRENHGWSRSVEQPAIKPRPPASKATAQRARNMIGTSVEMGIAGEATGSHDGKRRRPTIMRQKL